MSRARLLSALMFTTVASGLMLSFGGCTQRNDAAYPDASVESRNRADAIRADGERRKEAIAKERDEHIQTENFQAKQHVEKARLERESITLNRDQEVQPLNVRMKELKAKAESDKDAVTDEAKIRTRGLDGAAAAAVTTEAEAKCAEIASKAAADQADVARKIDQADVKAREQTAKVDAREPSEVAETQKRIDALNRDARERQLKIDQETAKALNDLGKDSTKRVEKSQATAADQLESDMRISHAVRADLDRDRRTYNVTTVAVKDGVVTLGGDIPSEAARKQALNYAIKTKGVVRVDDQMRLKAP